jgi:MFS family permease
LVFIPKPKVTQAGQEGSGNIFKEASYGFWYILRRPSLLGLQIVFLTGNFLVGITLAVQVPMILASTGNNELALASVNSAGAVGGVVGGLLMSAWGGPKRLVHGVLLGWALSSLFGTTLMGFGNSIPVWAVASFIGVMFVPIINGSNQAIWQAKVAPDVQGRVFSIRRLIAWFVSPLAMLIAGPMADFVLEPAMMADGALAGTFGWLVGTGPGAGMSLMFIFMGLSATVVTLGAYAFPVIRDAEILLPDHDMSPKAADDSLLARLHEILEERKKLLPQPESDQKTLALKNISSKLRDLGRQRSA